MQLQPVLGAVDQPLGARQLQGGVGNPCLGCGLMPEREAAGGGDPQDQPASRLELFTPGPQLLFGSLQPLQGKARGQGCRLLQVRRQSLIEIPVDQRSVLTSTLLEEGAAGVDP